MHLDPLPYTLPLDSLLGFVIHGAACLEDDLHFVLGQKLEVVQNHAVDAASPKAAPDAEDNRLRRVKLEERTTLLPCSSHLLNVSTDRIAGKDQLVGRKETLHALVGHTDAVCTPRESLVGESCIGVLLLQKCGVAHTLGHAERWLAGKAPDTDNNIGLETAQNAAHYAAAAQHLEGQLQVLDNIGQGELALQPGNG